MKTPLLFIILLLSAVTFGQTAFETKLAGLHNKDAFTVKYDKFDDKTQLTFKGGVVKNEKAYEPYALEMSGLAFFEGKAQTDNVQGFGLLFKSATSDWAFLRSNKLVLLLDDDIRIDLGDASRTSKVVTGAGYRSANVTEHLLYFPKYDQFALLAKAKKIEMKIGIFQGALEEKELALIRNFFVLGTK